MRILNKILFLFLFLFLFSCYHSTYRFKSMDKDLAKNVIIAEGATDERYNGVWVTKRRYYHIERDTITQGYFIFKFPIEMAKSEDFILLRNDKKYLIIELKNDSLQRWYGKFRSEKRFNKKKEKLNVPDSLVFKKIF